MIGLAIMNMLTIMMVSIDYILEFNAKVYHRTNCEWNTFAVSF